MLCKTLVYRHTASVLLPPWTHLKYRAHFPSGLRQFLSLFSTSEYPKLLVDFIYCLSFVNKVPEIRVLTFLLCYSVSSALNGTGHT